MKSIVFLIAGICGLTASAATITRQVVRQNWPWDSKVTINYVLGSDTAESYDIDLKVTDAAGNDVTGVTSAQSGDCMDVIAGEHDLVWDPVAAGVDIASQAMLKFELTPKKPIGKPYLVIDLSAGIGGTYPVEYLDEPPSGGFNTTEYKTSKMVFRRCRAGSYIMGSPTTEEGRGTTYMETQHKVTLTKDFYIGVFELTEGQSSRIWTTNVSCSASSTEAFGTLILAWAYRGSAKNWPGNSSVESGSLVGRIRTGVTSGLPDGYVIDLPTEAQWEYACRAGTTTAWNNGSNTAYHVIYSTGVYVKDASGNLIPKDEVIPGAYGDYSMDTLGQYASSLNKLDSTYTKEWYWGQHWPPGTVGRFLPNVWGLYDMHGNAAELCVDTYSGNQDLGSADQTDPWYASGSDYVMARGGHWLTCAPGCRSAARNIHYLNTKSGDQGITVRLAIVPEKK